jgi:protein-histidine pros-kinase
MDGEAKMKLIVKLNVLLVALLGTGMALLALFAHRFLTENAREQVAQQAEMMMESARAVRNYTSRQVKPLIEQLPQHQRQFLPQLVPAYAATATLSQLRQTYPDFTYKEAAINPTNLGDRANDWEADVIANFRKNPDQTEFMGERELPTGRVLFLAAPIRAEHGCMDCHGSPAKAPAPIVRTYGRDDGFRWSEGDVVAAQIVSVPMTVPVRIAREVYKDLILYIAGMMVASLVFIDIVLWAIVLRPMRRLSAKADQISRGKLDSPFLVVSGHDEIAVLYAAFNRIQASLRTAVRMLDRNRQIDHDYQITKEPAL